MKQQIKIAGTSYPLKFGFAAFRHLGSAWDCKGVQAVVNEFQGLFPEKGDTNDITFEAADKLADLAFAGMYAAGVEDFPDTDETINALLFEGQLKVVMQCFTDALPKQGNPEPAKKSRPTKKKTVKKK